MLGNNTYNLNKTSIVQHLNSHINFKNKGVKLYYHEFSFQCMRKNILPSFSERKNQNSIEMHFSYSTSFP